MKILILNGSPRPDGNTVDMIKAYAEGAKEAGHSIQIVDVCRKNIRGCLACEYCHTKGNGKCIQQDDMKEVYPLLEEAEMIVLASPIYYHSFTGQLQCAINRIYALDKPKNLEKQHCFCLLIVIWFTVVRFSNTRIPFCSICILKIAAFLRLMMKKISQKYC